MSLPTAWVDRIFEKLTLTYGKAFVARWADCGVKITDVKTEWAFELAGFGDWPEAIAYALQNLPAERPPTVLQFRDLCRSAPRKAALALPEPKADPERVRQEMAKLGALRDNVAAKPKHDGREWARRILVRVEGGERMSPTVVQMARNAIESRA